MVEALGILFFNKNAQYLCDRMTSAAKVLAAGAGVIIGTNVQETVQIKLTGAAIPGELKNVIAAFAGSLSTGLLTITFLFYIDNDPFGKFLGKAYGEGINNLKKQGILFREYCARLSEIDIERLNYEASCAYNLSVRLENAVSQAELNAVLKAAASSLGIPALLGNYTLDEKMNDKKWMLKF